MSGQFCVSRTGLSFLFLVRVVFRFALSTQVILLNKIHRKSPGIWLTFNLRYAKIAVCRADLRQGTLITRGEKEKTEMKELKELKEYKKLMKDLE